MIRRCLNYSPQFASGLAVLVGVTVVLGWVLDLPLLKNFLPGMYPMRLNTGVCFILTGVAFWIGNSLARLEPVRFARGRNIVWVCAGLVVLVNGLRLLEYIFEWNLGIDEALFFHPVVSGAAPRGKTAPATAIAFMVLNLALMLLPGGPGRRRLIGVGLLGALTALLGSFTVLGYFGNITVGYGWSNLTTMALPAGGAFMLLGVSCVFWAWRAAGLHLAVRGGLLAGFALGLAMFIAVGLFSYKNVWQLVETADLVRHAHEVRTKLREVYLNLTDLHTTGRSYVGTGDEASLAQYHQALRSLEANQAELRRLAGNNPSQRQQIAALETLILERQKYTQDAVNVRRTSGAEGVAKWIAATGVAENADRIRSLMLKMERDEETIISQTESPARDFTAWTFFVLPVGMFIGVGLFLAGLFSLNSEAIERQQAQASRFAAETKYRQLVEQSISGIYVIQDGRFAYVNPKMIEIFGFSAAEFAARPLFDFIFEGDHALVKSKLDQRFSGQIDSARYSLRMLRRDGKVVEVEVHGSRAEFNGQPAILGTLLDITQSRSLEKQLRQAQKMDAVGTLAGGIAHDFNNILSAINGYAELARMDSSNSPTVHEYLDEVSKAGRRAIDLVRQILTFSRQQEQERKPIQLRHVVAEAFKLLRATLPATIQFNLSLSPNAPMVLADASQIHQIAMNLGTNATHAMRDRPGRLEATLEGFEVDADLVVMHPELRPGRYARLSISDTGHGMDRVTLDRIFEPFFTTKAPGEGTGLGLSVVHGIMKAHDGCITVYSELGQGTIFHLYFPALAGDEPEVAAGVAAIPHGEGERILFLDDEEALVMLGKKMLERLGYTVATETNPLIALAIIRANPDAYDLIITDLTMPRMTGVELARQILQYRPDLPIILATGYAASLTAASIQALGIRELLHKPVSRQSLGETVHRVLNSSTPPVFP